MNGARAVDRVGADRVGGGWVGTVAAPGGDEAKVAVITTVASTRDAALEAARRWVENAENGGEQRESHGWCPSAEYPGRFDVVRRGRLGDTRVPVEVA